MNEKTVELPTSVRNFSVQLSPTPRGARLARLLATRRGLLLVEVLADRWGVAEGRFPRKTVWAELRCTPPQPTF
ncbi:hypothetical protein [Streptomyces sp. AC602_WCS936]|uniref:hypothetical protein n=1 Tax=Streptomyces sp. AC602_WCS936 TaxID=2823685 RepID=UPI001C269FF0|nr:hypothetical protein [Streptomyces sp. AC602_WCS936]